MKITKSQLKQIIKEELEKVVDEGRYSYDWNIPGNPSPMDDYDNQQRYARAKPKKSKKSSDEPSPEEQEENWKEWQDLHPYEQISPSQKQSIMKHGREAWPAYEGSAQQQPVVSELSDAERKEIEKFMPGRKITSPEDVEKRRKEREQEASMPKDKAPSARRPKKRRGGSKYRPYGRST